jgi:hypothetical protein
MNQLQTTREQLDAVNDFFGHLQQHGQHLQYDEPEALAA